MIWDRWKTDRFRGAGAKPAGERRLWRGDSHYDGDPDPFDHRLPLATAVPLWALLSMLGWLIIAVAATHLVQIAPQFRSTKAPMTFVGTSAFEAAATVVASEHPLH